MFCILCVPYDFVCIYMVLHELILNHQLVFFFQVSPKEVVYDSKGKLLVSPVVLSNRI